MKRTKTKQSRKQRNRSRNRSRNLYAPGSRYVCCWTEYHDGVDTDYGVRMTAVITDLLDDSQVDALDVWYDDTTGQRQASDRCLDLAKRYKARVIATVAELEECTSCHGGETPCGSFLRNIVTRADLIQMIVDGLVDGPIVDSVNAPGGAA